MKYDDVRRMINLIPDAAILVSREQVVSAANPRAADIFRTSVETLEGMPLKALIPEQSKSSHTYFVEAFFNQLKPRPMGTGARFRGQRADGTEFPIDIMIDKLTIAGKTYAIGIIRDNSDRIAIQTVKEELQLTNARLARAQVVGGLGWWEYNPAQNELIWSDMTPQLLGLSEETPPSFQAISDRCVAEDKKRIVALHGNLEELNDDRLTYQVQRPDGVIRWLEETIMQEHNHRVLGVMRDITEQKQLEEQLRTESVTDSLTQLFNRRQFTRDLKARYAGFVRNGINSSLVMYDFDHFKDINDRYGHSMGDEVLKKCSALVVSQLRPDDHAYRLGGEEFIILLSGENADAARVPAERIRQSIESTRIELDSARISTTISLGITQFRRSDTAIDDALRRVDEALYESKARSPNTLTVIE